MLRNEFLDGWLSEHVSQEVQDLPADSWPYGTWEWDALPHGLLTHPRVQLTCDTAFAVLIQTPQSRDVRVILSGHHDGCLLETFLQIITDHRILSRVHMLQEETIPRAVVLVFKETNLRMKASHLTS